MTARKGARVASVKRDGTSGRILLADVLVVAGGVCIAGGVSAWSIPAAAIVSGLLLWLTAWALSARG
jgi:hypothetical protein